MLRWIVLLMLAMLVVAVHAAEPALAAGGTAVIPPHAFVQAYQAGAQSERGTVAVVPADAPDADRAVRVTSTEAVDSPWSWQILVPIAEPVKKGDVLYVEAWFRAVQPMAETGESTSGLVFEDSKTFDKSLDFEFSAGREWKHVYQAFESRADYAPGGARLIFRAGFRNQSFEVAGVRLLDFQQHVKVADLPSMPFTYAGRAPEAPWRTAALERIEQIRKAPLTVQVVDAAGQPVPNAAVHVQMTRHKFLFGTAVASNMIQPGEATPEMKQYRQLLEGNFNAATIENNLKWPGWLGQRDRGLAALHWLNEHHFNVRGHNLVWPSWHFMPRQLRDKYENDLAPMQQITIEHIRDEVTATKGMIDRWDVVNEPVANHLLMDTFGWGEMARWYKLVHELDPKPLLCLNDYSILSAGGIDYAHQDALIKVVKDLQAAGAPVQALGLQGHMGMNATPPERVLTVLDRFAKLGLPIEITEYDMPGRDEQLQADYTRDFLIAAYSHPDVFGFTMWGFWEGRHWKKDAAMFRRDFSPKPAAVAWHDLVYRDWWTDCTETTDARGSARVRGFLGDYQLTVMHDGRQTQAAAQLAAGGTHMVVTLK